MLLNFKYIILLNLRLPYFFIVATSVVDLAVSLCCENATPALGLLGQLGSTFMICCSSFARVYRITERMMLTVNHTQGICVAFVVQS